MPVSELPQVMLICLVITIVIEAVAGFLFGVRKPKDQLFILLVNVMTNPVLTSATLLSYLWLGSVGFHVTEAVLEIAIVFAEGLVYKAALDRRHPFLLSLALNACSYFAGEIIGAFIF